VHEGPYGNIIGTWKRNAGMINWSVTVPANSTATIYLPVTDGQQLYENGKLVTGAAGVIRAAGKHAAGKQVYQVPAGTFHFEIR
jgi:alpha-L-rhamnosidase